MHVRRIQGYDMNKIKIIAALVFVFAAVGVQAKPKERKSLVVYFSRADENSKVGYITEGNTAIVAKLIAEKMHADIFEIVPEKPYPADYESCVAYVKEEQRNKARPAYTGDVDIEPYDTIFIGYPIWWGDLPPVVYTFIEEHDMDGKTIIPFCTHEGSGMSGTARVFRRMFKHATVNTGISVLGHIAQNDRHKADIAVTTQLKLMLRFI